MKKTIVPIVAFLFLACIWSCKKDSTNTSGPVLEASKTSSIKKGEPVVFKLPQVDANSAVNWSVNPSANTQVNANGNQASILFGKTGSYSVTASFGSVTATNTVSVSDSAYKLSGPATTLALKPGEVINITASRLDSGSNSGLIFSAQTTNAYTCSGNSLISEATIGTGSYKIDFKGVSVPDGCTNGTAKAGAFNSLYPIPTGTTTLTIVVNGTSYTGSIEKTGNSYKITWTNTSAVSIAPLSL
ncbi:MAG: hypothetical protein JST75_16970 [Bacteroidetes bacterium]|nr:hypothetical protein [Bacteroidota bacterium]